MFKNFSVESFQSMVPELRLTVYGKDQFSNKRTNHTIVPFFLACCIVFKHKTLVFTSI